jgi:hypothetical protein
MKPDNSRDEDLRDVAEKSAEVDRLLAQAKKLSAELVATVNMLNSVVVTKEQKDGN